MTQLEREIQKCRILSVTTVRASGSVHSEHLRRTLWDICGKPCIQWTLETVKSCKYVDRMVVITEDRKIKKVVEDMGIKVIDRPLFTVLDYPRDYSSGPFKKDNPRSLRSKIPDVFLNPLEYVQYWLREKEGYSPDLILYACASYPMLTVDTTNRVIEAFFKDKEATESGSFAPGPHQTYIENAKTGRPFPLLFEAGHDRQIYPNTWILGPLHLYGLSKYPTSPGRKIAAIYVTEEEALDLHTEEDLFKARCYMKRRLLREGKEVKWEIGQDDKQQYDKEESQ